MIKVELSTLVHAKNGKLQRLILDLGELSIDHLVLNYLRGELHLTRVNTGIMVKGVIESEIASECTRCLASFNDPVVIELEDVISLPGADLTPERPVRVSENGWVDLTPLIREYVWVTLRPSPICSPDCRGICPQCGGNINLGECACEDQSAMDPRWEALRSWLDDAAGPA